MSYSGWRMLTLGAALVLAACGGDGPSAPSTPTMGVVRMGNNANVPIIEVNIAACTSPVWGGNRLAASQTIEPGQDRLFSVAPGCYDFRAQTASKAGSWYQRHVFAGDTVHVALSAAANETPEG